jgi:hypothetical protein
MINSSQLSSLVISGVLALPLSLAVGSGVAGAHVASAPDTSVHACTGTFSATGETRCVVGSGVKQLIVRAVGGNGSDVESLGGAGAVVVTALRVTAGDTLFVEVGGTQGDITNGGGDSPFGAGGGATDIQTCSASDTGCVLTGNPASDPRLVVAGGGGGAGEGEVNGGNGGSAGVTSVTGPGAGGAGHGASTAGGNGRAGGVGGTSGGAGGAGSGAHNGGAAGVVGTGGSVPASGAAFVAGGGGGGFFGGGAGGGGGDAGGGGGGSSYVSALASHTTISHTKNEDVMPKLRLTPNAPAIRSTVTSAHAKTIFGWYRSNPTIAFSCTPGAAPYTAAGCPKPVRVTREGRSTVVRTVTDTDGTRATVTTRVYLDKVKPVLRVRGAVKGHTYAHRRHLSCHAHDVLSHLGGPCVLTTHKHGRTVRYRAKVRDEAGNLRKVSGFYRLTRRT